MCKVRPLIQIDHCSYIMWKNTPYRLLGLVLALTVLLVPIAEASPISGTPVKLEKEQAEYQLAHVEEEGYLAARVQGALPPYSAVDPPIFSMWGGTSSPEDLPVVLTKASEQPVIITVAGGLAVVKVVGASGAVVATITTGVAAYKAFDFLDSVGSRIEDARKLAEILSENKDEVAKYAKMSYDTLYSLCHDKGGGMISVPSVTEVKKEIKEDYIFGVPEKNAVCVAD